MRFADIDLSKLPAPDAIREISFEETLSEIKAELIQLGDEIEFDFRPTLELEPDITLKLLQAFAARERRIRADANDQVKAILPAFAVGPDLQHLAARNGVEQKITIVAGINGDPDTEIVEDNEDLRARMQLALEAFSTAGPHGAYLFHLLAIEGVADGEIYGHDDGLLDGDENELIAPAEVLVVVLANTEDGIADADLLALVKERLSAKSVRPIGDKVIIEAASIPTYEIDITLKVYGGPDASIAETQARTRLEKYTSDNFSVARSHRLSGIAAAAHIEGAVDEVIITNPVADIIPEYNEAARCTAINLTVEQVTGGWNA